MKYCYTLLLLCISLITATDRALAQQCPQPNFIQVDNLTGTTATMTWLPVTGAIGYSYGLTTTQTPPQNGVMTASTSVLLQGLTPNTFYCFYVQTRCNNGTSPWGYLCFYTNCINGTDSLAIKVMSMNSVAVTWTPFGANAEYECAITKDFTPPSTGSRITKDSILLEGLQPLTQYCFHLRAFCNSSSTYTDWHTECFTIPATGINNVSDNNIPAVYPNPAQNELNINLPELSSRHIITIKDITGRTVYNTQTESAENKANISDLANGMYIITISGKEYNSVQKVSVNK